MSNRNIYAAARNAAGLTQERAAECLAISVRSLADYESGVRLPSEEMSIMRSIWPISICGRGLTWAAG